MSFVHIITHYIYVIAQPPNVINKTKRYKWLLCNLRCSTFQNRILHLQIISFFKRTSDIVSNVKQIFKLFLGIYLGITFYLLNSNCYFIMAFCCKVTVIQFHRYYYHEISIICMLVWVLLNWLCGIYRIFLWRSHVHIFFQISYNIAYKNLCCLFCFHTS